MTLEELHNRIGQLIEMWPSKKDNEVCVLGKRQGGVGGSKVHNVKSVNNGFDWNAYKTFIVIEGFEKGI